MLLACALPLTACSSIQGTGEKGYVSANSQVREIAPADRGEPVELAAETLEGKPISLADMRGDVVVVNVWWSNCGPCRKEAPMLTEVEKQTADLGVRFLGINIRDSSAANGLAFQRRFDITFPSVYDPSGEAILAFQGVPPNAVPTTLVLDREGRIAARVLGDLPSAGTLKALVTTVAEEGSS